MRIRGIAAIRGSSKNVLRQDARSDLGIVYTRSGSLDFIFKARGPCSSSRRLQTLGSRETVRKPSRLGKSLKPAPAPSSRRQARSRVGLIESGWTRGSAQIQARASANGCVLLAYWASLPSAQFGRGRLLTQPARQKWRQSRQYQPFGASASRFPDVLTGRSCESV